MVNRTKTVAGRLLFVLGVYSLIEWGHQNQHRPANAGPSNLNMIPTSSLFRGFTKGWFSKRVVLADVPPGTKTGTRVHSDVPLE